MPPLPVEEEDETPDYLKKGRKSTNLDHSALFDTSKDLDTSTNQEEVKKSRPSMLLQSMLAQDDKEEVDVLAAGNPFLFPPAEKKAKPKKQKAPPSNFFGAPEEDTKKQPTPPPAQPTMFMPPLPSGGDKPKPASGMGLFGDTSEATASQQIQANKPVIKKKKKKRAPAPSNLFGDFDEDNKASEPKANPYFMAAASPKASLSKLSDPLSTSMSKPVPPMPASKPAADPLGASMSNAPPALPSLPTLPSDSPPKKKKKRPANKSPFGDPLGGFEEDKPIPMPDVGKPAETKPPPQKTIPTGPKPKTSMKTSLFQDDNEEDDDMFFKAPSRAKKGPKRKFMFDDDD
jgi:hypothetical protein